MPMPNFAIVLVSIPASSGTMESERLADEAVLNKILIKTNKSHFCCCTVPAALLKFEAEGMRGHGRSVGLFYC
jgi:hypothetical protein